MNLLAKRYQGLRKSIWGEFSALAATYKAVNLGQGFGDYPPPKYVIDFYKQVIEDPNILLYQYTRGFGHKRLVEAISAFYSRYFYRKLDPLNQVLVTPGACISLFNALHGLINPGDEIILIEPFFTCYESMIQLSGGIPRYISLRNKRNAIGENFVSSADWILDYKELESLFNTRTRAIILNTPHNPLGKVFTGDELENIARLCQKYNVICISDEVYEWFVYGNQKKHIRIATLPNMWERTLTIGSAGKMFSCTGFKLGWTIGPENLLRICQTVHQNTMYSCSTLLQEVVALCLEHEMNRLGTSECYFDLTSSQLENKCNRLLQVLKECNMKAIVPDAGYFILVDLNRFLDEFKSDEIETKDSKIIRYLTKEKNLSAMPATGFFCHEHRQMGENYIRLCFAKTNETLEKAIKVLKDL